MVFHFIGQDSPASSKIKVQNIQQGSSKSLFCSELCQVCSHDRGTQRQGNQSDLCQGKPHMLFLDHVFENKCVTFSPSFCCRFLVRCHISVDQVGVITFLSFQGTSCNNYLVDQFSSFLPEQYMFGDLLFTWENYNFSVIRSGAGAHLFRSWATFLNRSIILTTEVCAVCDAINMCHIIFKEARSCSVKLSKF